MACEAIDRVVDILQAGGPAAGPVRSLIGCTVAEIQHLMQAQGLHHLPETYRCFLARFGTAAGGFLARDDGSDWRYPDLLKVRTVAKRILEDNGHPFTLDPTDVVIAQYLDQQFHFLRPGRGDPHDPAVWTYLEGYAAPVKVSPRYSEFLLGLAQEFTTGTPLFDHDYFAGVARRGSP